MHTHILASGSRDRRSSIHTVWCHCTVRVYAVVVVTVDTGSVSVVSGSVVDVVVRVVFRLGVVVVSVLVVSVLGVAVVVAVSMWWLISALSLLLGLLLLLVVVVVVLSGVCFRCCGGGCGAPGRAWPRNGFPRIPAGGANPPHMPAHKWVSMDTDVCRTAHQGRAMHDIRSTTETDKPKLKQSYADTHRTDKGTETNRDSDTERCVRLSLWV